MGLFDKLKKGHSERKEKSIQKVVGDHLGPNEEIEEWIRSADSLGALTGKFLIATNERLLFINRDNSSVITKDNLQSFNYENIESIDTEKGALSTLHVVAGINVITLDSLDPKVVNPFIDHVNQKRNETKSTNTTNTIINEAPEKSTAEQLKELRELVDEGILTEEEFNAKKVTLLELDL